MCTGNGQTFSVLISGVDKMLDECTRLRGITSCKRVSIVINTKTAGLRNQGKTLLTLTYKWEANINIKVDLTEMRSYCVGLTQIVEDRVQCWIFVNTIMKLSIL